MFPTVSRPNFQSNFERRCFMSRSDSPRSTRQQTTVFLLASLATACIMLGSGTLIQSSVGEDLRKLNSGTPQGPLQAQDPLQKYADIAALSKPNRRALFSSLRLMIEATFGSLTWPFISPSTQI